MSATLTKSLSLNPLVVIAAVPILTPLATLGLAVMVTVGTFGLDSATVAAKYWAKNPPIRCEAAQIEQMPPERAAS